MAGIPTPNVADKDQRVFNRAVKQLVESQAVVITQLQAQIRQLQARPVSQQTTVVREASGGTAGGSPAAGMADGLLGLLLPIGDAGGQSQVPLTLLTAGATIAAYDLLALDGAAVEPASSLNSAHFYGVTGFAKGPASSGGAVEVAVSGEVIENPAWSWTPGQLLWVSETDGASATSAIGATTPVFYQIVGLALTATKVLVWIEEPVLIWNSSNPDATAEALENAAAKLITTRPDGAREEFPLVNPTVVGLTTLRQSADSVGFRIEGFDDQSGVNLQSYITSTGLTRLVASGLLSFGGTRFLFGTTSDDATNLAQFAGSVTTTGVYKVNNVQVVGARLGAVGTGSTSGAAYTGIDNLWVGTVYARVADLNNLAALYDALVGVVNTIAARLQTHGLTS
jgi:hypothetical protein